MEATESLERRDARVIALIMAASHAAYAAFVAAYKSGPEEFFPIVTRWRVPHPMDGPVPTLAMLAMVLSSLLLMAVGGKLPRPAGLAYGLAFPWTLAALAIVPNAPHAYVLGYAVAATLAAAAFLAAATLDRSRPR